MIARQIQEIYLSVLKAKYELVQVKRIIYTQDWTGKEPEWVIEKDYIRGSMI